MGNLEADFAAIVQSHAKQNFMLKRDADKAKREALAAGAVAAELFVDCVNGGVQEVFINEKRIEQEARALKDTVQRFAQQSNQWLTVFNEFDSALKEIGDFENWIQVMEKDCEVIGTVLSEISSAPKA